MFIFSYSLFFNGNRKILYSKCSKAKFLYDIICILFDVLVCRRVFLRVLLYFDELARASQNTNNE